MCSGPGLFGNFLLLCELWNKTSSQSSFAATAFCTDRVTKLKVHLQAVSGAEHLSASIERVGIDKDGDKAWALLQLCARGCPPTTQRPRAVWTFGWESHQQPGLQFCFSVGHCLQKLACLVEVLFLVNSMPLELLYFKCRQIAEKTFVHWHKALVLTSSNAQEVRYKPKSTSESWSFPASAILQKPQKSLLRNVSSPINSNHCALKVLPRNRSHNSWKVLVKQVEYLFVSADLQAFIRSIQGGKTPSWEGQ